MRLALYLVLFVVILLPAVGWALNTFEDHLSAIREERTRQRTGALRKRRPF